MAYRMRRKEFLLLFLTAVLWGVSFFFIKVAVHSFAPCTVVAGRLFFASVFLLGYLFFTGEKLPRLGRQWIPFAVMGITNCTVPYLLISWGEIYIDSGLAAILGATMPLFTILLGLFLTRQEVMTWRKGSGILVGLAGVILLIGPEAMKGLGVHVWAQLANVMAAASYAYAAVYGTVLKDVKPVVASTGQVVTGFLTIFPFMLGEAPWTMQPTAQSLFALACLGLFSTAIPYVIYFHLLTVIGPTNISLVTYLIPLVGMITGVLLLGEQVTFLSVLALIFILAGVAGVSVTKEKQGKETKAHLPGL